MAGPSVIVLPEWQGSVRPLARQLVSGAARLAALARGRGAQVLEPGGFGAGRSPLRDGVDSYDVLLAAHARATQVLPDGPLWPSAGTAARIWGQLPGRCDATMVSWPSCGLTPTLISTR